MKKMNFSNWLNEEQEPIPDAREFIYLACVLTYDDQPKMFNLANQVYTMSVGKPIPDTWKKVTHHMTVKAPGELVQSDLENPLMGKQVDLSVEWASIDQYAMAFKVKPNPAFQLKRTPHVTIAFDSKNASPKYSNDILANPENNVRVARPALFESFLVAVGRDNTTWPKVPVALARPNL